MARRPAAHAWCTNAACAAAPTHEQTHTHKHAHAQIEPGAREKLLVRGTGIFKKLGALRAL